MKYNEIIIERVSVKSHNVKSIGYSDEYEIMAVEMLNEKLYYYIDIPKIHFNNILNHIAIGSYMNRNIKGKFRFIEIN